MGLDMFLLKKSDEKEAKKLAYWRKANQIHGWFSENIEGGVNNCEEHPISREMLKELVDICKEIMADHSLAEEKLPVCEGFFYGSTEYDSWYFEDIEDTMKQLEEILNDPENNDAEFVYCAWW